MSDSPVYTATAEQLRSKQVAMVAVPKDMEALMSHPLVTDTPNGTVIAAMAINATLEAMAKSAEEN